MILFLTLKNLDSQMRVLSPFTKFKQLLKIKLDVQFYNFIRMTNNMVTSVEGNLLSSKIDQKEEEMFSQNQEILQKFNNIIERRLSNGYYAPIDSRKPRKHFHKNNPQPKIINRIKKYKKKKKQVTQEKEDFGMNTSFQVEEKPLMEDYQVQFVWQIEQEDQSAQWCYQPEKQSKEVQIGAQYCDIQVQCYLNNIQHKQVIENLQNEIQVLTEVKKDKSKEVQSLHSKLHEATQKQQVSKYKINGLKSNIAKCRENNSFLKLRQLFSKLNGQIDQIQSRESILSLKIKNQAEKQQQRQKIKRQKEKEKYLFDKYIQDAQDQRKKSSMSYKKECENLLKQQKDDETSNQISHYQKEVQQLRKQIFAQQHQRLSFNDLSHQSNNPEQRETRETNITSQQIKIKLGQIRSQKNPSCLQLGRSHKYLSPRNIGSIVKNSPQKIQNQMNKHYQKTKQIKSYWNNKSENKYRYEKVKQQRLTRKAKFVSKFDCLEQKQLSQLFQIKSKIKTSSLLKPIQKYRKIQQTYTFQSLLQIMDKIKKTMNLIDIKEDLNQIEIIQLGQQTFKIINQKFKMQAINIISYPHQIVFESTVQNFFIIWSFNKSFYFGYKNLVSSFNRDYYCTPQRFKNGEGFQYDNKGSIYGGVFQDGKRHGCGRLIDCGFMYQGQFSQEKQEGFGRLQLPNKDIYEGQFKANKFNGQGIYYYQNGDVFQGNFTLGMKKGEGMHNYINGDQYIGSYNNNKRQGRGKYIWSNQHRQYCGQFKNNMKNGFGKMIDDQGKCLCGVWKNDRIVSVENFNKKLVPSHQIHLQDMPILKKRKEVNQ